MNYAILSDIHGNADALESVLKEVRKLNIEKIFCLGDMVGYYYHPDRVLELLSEWDCSYIKGNHEDMLISMINDDEEKFRIKEKYGSGHEKALEKLSDNQISWIKQLPESTTVELDNLKLQLCHGSPQDKGLYLYPDADLITLQKAATYGDFVFIGHSHYPFIYGHQDSVLVNAGSVGQLREKGGLASWAILNTSSQTVRMKYTQYDTNKLVEEVKRTDTGNDYLWKVLIR